MKFEDIYNLLIQFFNLNVDFNIIFDKVEQPYKKEILDFIDFIKKNPDVKKISNYNISERSKIIILKYIEYILSKTKN